MCARAILLFFFIVLFYTGCQPTPPAPTPEEVLKKYQAHFDNNEFEAAKKLSTELGKEWIDAISPLIIADGQTNSILTTTFHKINCQSEVDTTICQCQLEDDNELYEATFKLIRVNGEWLVHAPEEDESIEYDEDEELITPSPFKE